MFKLLKHIKEGFYKRRCQKGNHNFVLDNTNVFIKIFHPHFNYFKCKHCEHISICDSFSLISSARYSIYRYRKMIKKQKLEADSKRTVLMEKMVFTHRYQYVLNVHTGEVTEVKFKICMNIQNEYLKDFLNVMKDKKNVLRGKEIIVSESYIHPVH